MTKTHIVIPDSHSHPDYPNDRYTWLGELISDIKPDTVVDIGDWFDMPSLCSYDKGLKSFEGRRYARDVAAGIEAQDRMVRPLRRQKKKLPRFVRCLGNHEHRIIRAIDRDPILEGTIGLGDLQSREYGWEEHPFLDVVNIDGINYSHYFTSGVLGRPIGGNNAAKMLVDQKHETCVQGHDHRFMHYKTTSASGRKINGLFVGCFQDYDADYAGPANKLWDRGVVILRNVEEGNFDIEWISLERLRQVYAG